MPFVLRPPTEFSTGLAVRLSEVGRSRRRAKITAGVFATIAVAIFLFVTSCLMDISFHLPASIRAGLLAFTLVAVAAIILRRIVSAYRQSATAHATAMLVESNNPQLNDALASAVEFSAGGERGSERFRAIAVKRAENQLQNIEVERLIPHGKASGAFLLAFLACLIFTAFVSVKPSFATRATIRFVDPFGWHPWPAQTTITVIEPSEFPRRMAKGDSLAVRFIVAGRIPEIAQLSLRLSEGQTVDEPVPLRPEETSSDAVTNSLTIDASRIPRDFEFRLAANDADTGWLKVAVAPPPRLVPRDGRPSPQVRIDLPEYTRMPAAELPDGTGIIEAVAGTRIRMAAAADRRIVRAEIVPLSEPSSVHVAASVAPVASLMQPLLASARVAMADAYVEPIPVLISGPESTWFDVEFIPRWPGLHALKITDDTGLTGTRLFDLRIYPDPTPSLTLDRPAAGQDALILLPTARITLASRADDRTFGLKTVWLDYRHKDCEYRKIPLADYAALGRSLPGLAGGSAYTPNLSSSTASVFGVMPLSRFVKPDGTRPSDGDTITLRTAADDWDDVSVLKLPGRSREVVIRVVSKSTLDAVLQKSLAEVRPILRETLARERESMKLVKEFEKALESKETLSPSDREKLAAAERVQRDVKAKLADMRDGLRQRVEELQRTAKANGLPPVGTAAQVDAAARTIARLADENLDVAEGALNEARANAEKATANSGEKEAIKNSLNAAQENQQAVESGLSQLMDRLAQWGGAGEVRADAQSLKEKVAAAGDEIKSQNDPNRKETEAGANQKKLADELNKLADEANGLLGKAAKIANEKETQAGAAGADPEKASKAQEEAAALRDAVEKAGGLQLPADLRAASAAAKAGRTGDAESARASAADRLNKMTEALVEKRNEPTAEELKKNRKRDESELEKLKEEVDELRKKSKRAEENPDPEERKAELERLAPEQEKLQKETEKLAEKLSRDRAEKTAESVKRAAEQMAAAAKEQRQGRPANEEQQDAAEKLQDAKNEFKRETKEADEQLEREEREKILERIKSLRDRQAAAIAEVKRLLAEAVKAKRWDRPLLVSLSDLAEAENVIASELRPFAEKELASFPVFHKLASSAADALEKAKVRIAERKDDLLTTDPGAAFDAETEAIAHGRVLQPMLLAIKRLDLLLDAVKPDTKKPDGANANPMPGGAPMEGGVGGGGPQGPGIPPLAQLKALRGMQADLNERTTAFHQSNPDATKHDDATRDELKELERDQREISELFEKMLSLLQPMQEVP